MDDVVAEPSNNGAYPTAPKVKWAAIGSSLAGALLVWLAGALGDASLVEGVPDWAAGIIAGLATGGVTLGAGRSAPHQVRMPDQGSAFGGDQVG